MIRVLRGDCRDVLRALPEKSVHCCVTSPPYWGLRDYGTATWTGGYDPACEHKRSVWEGPKQSRGVSQSGHAARKDKLGRRECLRCGAVRVDRQLGVEPTPDEYVAAMVEVFREVRRVLRDDGTLWLNLGDSYASGGGAHTTGSYDGGVGRGMSAGKPRSPPSGIKPKDLIGIPWLVAFALRADGWWLRKDIIWAKPNPMPESATDRPTSSHEHVFLLAKSARYFFDAEAVREVGQGYENFHGGYAPPTPTGPSRTSARNGRKVKVPGGWDQGEGAHGTVHRNGRTEATYQDADDVAAGRNIRDVWTIATAPFPEAHFATFPPDLAERCIRAGTSERGCCASCGAPWLRVITKGDPDMAHRAASGADASGGYNGHSTKNHDANGVQNASDVKRRILDGMREKVYDWKLSCKCDVGPVPCTVLDPFGGAGTTGLVADRLQRDAILIDLNTDYLTMAVRRIEKDGGMFAQVQTDHAPTKEGAP